MNKSSHWYDKDCTAVFEVPNVSKGGMRPTKITDAKKLGLFPSITTVLGILAKPALDDWKHRQITKACWDLTEEERFNNAAFGSLDIYHSRMVSNAFTQVSDAADLGTSIHKAIERHFQGLSYDYKLIHYVEAVDKWCQENGVKFIEHELRLASTSHGIAGTTDAVIESTKGIGILDFKSRKTKPEYPCTPWETEPMQIAAYDVMNFGGRATPERIGVNVYISTTEPGRVEATWYDHKQLNAAWDAFAAALNLWVYLNSYDPRNIPESKTT